MRKIIAILGLLFITVPALATEIPPSPDFDNVVKLRNQGTSADATVRVVKLVRFGAQGDSVESISVGEALVYSSISDDGVTIARSTTSGDGAFAGIAATIIQTADNTASNSAGDDNGRRNWGWIIIHGKANALAKAGGTNGHSIGDPFITSSDSGRVTSPELRASTSAIQAPSARAYANRGGFFLDAGDGTSLTYEVIVENV